MRVMLIRHGLTDGNLHKRYIGSTDEPLCQEGIRLLRLTPFPQCKAVFSSPMRRCRETAEILFPDTEAVIVPSLKECCFGRFEGKNYIELSDDPYYQKWIDSGGTLPFPDGEDPCEFRKRSVMGFYSAINSVHDADVVAFVVHGGTIMAVLEKLAVPHREYYDWNVSNGHGYDCLWDGSHLSVRKEL